MAPPTRADPVVPWAASLPTRIDIGPDKSPEPAERVPSWLADVDDDTLVIPAVKPARPAEPAESADAEITRVERIIPAETTRVEKAIPAEAPIDRSPAADAADSTAGDGGAPAEAASDEDVDDTPRDVEGADDGPETADVVDEPADAAAVAEPEVAAAEPEPAVAKPEVAAAAAAEPEADSRRVTVVPGVPRYHDEDCILVRFLDDGDVEHMSAAAAEQAGCTPCRACHPEED